MRININHATLSSEKPLGDAVWDAAHSVSVPIHSLGILGSEATIDLANGSLQDGSLSANTTITLPTPSPQVTEHLTLILYMGVVGGHAITITGVQWITGTAPVFDTAANAKNIVVLRWTGYAWVGDGGSFA